LNCFSTRAGALFPLRPVLRTNTGTDDRAFEAASITPAYAECGCPADRGGMQRASMGQVFWGRSSADLLGALRRPEPAGCLTSLVLEALEGDHQMAPIEVKFDVLRLIGRISGLR